MATTCACEVPCKKLLRVRVRAPCLMPGYEARFHGVFVGHRCLFEVGCRVCPSIGN